jgi:hypothetical protein
MVAVLVFWPQHTFINSMVGEGALAELMAVVVLYGWIWLFSGEGDYRIVAYIILGTLLGIWSKTTAAFLIPLNFGLFLWWFRRKSWHWRLIHWLYLFGSILAIGLALWGWSQSTLGKGMLVKISTLLDGSGLLWMDQRGVTFGKALLFTHDSFWANFGWMSLGVSERWYGALLLLTLLGFIGFIWNQADVEKWRTFLLMSFGVVALAVYVWAALLSKRSSSYYQFQGRYLFPIAVSYVFILMKGLYNLFSKIVQFRISVLLLLLMIGFDLWCMVGYIWPYYYGG